jgi:hypothetical protein
MIELGTQKQKTMSRTKLSTFLEQIVAMNLASIHLVNLLTTISKWVKPLNPKRSRPHTAKDHVMGIV